MYQGELFEIISNMFSDFETPGQYSKSHIENQGFKGFEFNTS